jgi:PEP-CTERM motif
MKWQFVLVLALSLIFASPSLADFNLRYDPVVEVGDGLWSYQVYITGSSPGGVPATVFNSVNVSGNAVQLSSGNVTNSTVLDTDVTGAPEIDQSYLAKDTHLITPDRDWISIIGGAIESNDGSIGTVSAGPWGAPHILGNGPITSTENDAYGFWIQTGEIHFMQVVLEGGKTADVSAQVYSSDFFYNVASISLPAPPVPEPSTIVMLVIGGLCLLIRRK